MKKTNTQKGITLVALIITIIVLLILAVVSIRAVQGDGIIQHAKNARQEYTQAQTNEQAQIQSYLYELEEGLDKPIKHSGIIPAGGVYTLADGTVLNAGQNFPDTVTDGDIYVYGDYKYGYNQQYDSNTSDWTLNTSQEGWGVRVLDNTKQEYGIILESVNGKDITNLYEAFQKCASLIKAPSIPNGVTLMAYTFAYCENLIDISSVIIPESAKDIHGAFNMCTSLEKIQTLKIPDDVTRMDKLFYGCESLVDASSLVIPDSVTRVEGMFRYCYMLKYAPKEIPNSVDKMNVLFEDCWNLECNIAINANPTVYSECFRNVDMTKVTLTGSSTMLDLIGATGLNYIN